MRMKLHEQVIHGVVNPIHLSEPVIHADNEKKRRSGHMGHGMTEFAPGKVIAFSASTSPVLGDGHAHFGWVEYAISEDYGDTFGEPMVLPYSMKSFTDGAYCIAVEKAITLDNGNIAAFCLKHPTGLKPDADLHPVVLISEDQGKTWNDPIQVSGYLGRIWDVLYRDGVTYVLQGCDVMGNLPKVYWLLKSEDNCRTFEHVSMLPIDPERRTYGNMIFTPEGDLIAYLYNFDEETAMDYFISHDNGRTWAEVGQSIVSKKIRNPQIGYLDGQYICTGRAGEVVHAMLHGAFVLYTSADGIHWDDGTILVAGRPCSFYSENLTMTLPDGSTKMLLKYSENYDEFAPGASTGRVNSMMLQITTCK